MSTNSFGADLDTRPVGMARDAEIRTIDHCKNCGYCSTDLSAAEKDTEGSLVYRLDVEMAMDS